MDSKQIRRMNLRALAEEVGGVTSLAKLAGSTQSYLSQIIGPNPCREVGDTLARKVEIATGREHGWLDLPQFSKKRQENARRVYDLLLEIPEKKLYALMELLGLESTIEATK